MVGEETTSVRNRRSAHGAPEEKEACLRNLEGNWLSSNASNGQIDDERTTRKMKLLAEAEQMKPLFMKGVDSFFTEFVNNLIAKSVLLESPSFTVPPAFQEKDHSKSKIPAAHGKVFVVRKSLLDELFEVEHIRTIYHMFIAILILFIISTLVVDFIDEGRLVLDFDLLVFAFGKLYVVVPAWLCMFLSTLVVPYGLFLQWAKGYHSSSHKTIRSSSFGILFMIFQIGLGVIPMYITLTHELPPASSFIVILEKLRLMMKAHSFIRENVPRVVSCPAQKSNSLRLPQVSQYLYFLFAPTLIYRDDYPRSPTRRWSYVATTFAQVLGSLFYVYYIFVRICSPIYRNYSLTNFSSRTLVLCIFNSILPGGLIFLLGFFLFLHSWLNIFAEMLRFGDRMFYKDWWNSTSFANFYRTWNVVVHDWLYYYVYKDFLWFFGKKFKAAGMLLVFTVSAGVHEYFLSVSLRCFYPVLFFLFMGFGMVFNFVLHDGRKGPIWNVIMWTFLFFGYSLLFCLYSQEWYAHQYCPVENPGFLDYVKPRSWSCHIRV